MFLSININSYERDNAFKFHFQTNIKNGCFNIKQKSQRNAFLQRPAFLFYNYQFTVPWLEQWFSFFFFSSQTILKQNPKDHRFLFIIMKIKKGNLRKWKEKEMPKHYETVVLECGCYCGYFKVCVCSLERRFEFAIRRKITLRKTLVFFFLRFGFNLIP